MTTTFRTLTLTLCDEEIRVVSHVLQSWADNNARKIDSPWKQPLPENLEQDVLTVAGVKSALVAAWNEAAND